MGGVIVPVVAKFVPFHELAGFPIAVSKVKEPGATGCPEATVVTAETSGTCMVGVSVPEVVPNSQVANMELGEQDEGGKGLVETTRVSVA